MTATHFYVDHRFDEKIRNGLPLRGMFGTIKTVPGMASAVNAGSSQNFPLIYTLVGVTVLSGLSWLGIVLLIFRWL